MGAAAAQSTRRRAQQPPIVIVGGGIAGLYAAYLLGLRGRHVVLFERSRDWGGRIDSQTVTVPGLDPLIAEFGPMRFEVDLQERLRRLCFHLKIEFEAFSPTNAPRSTTHHDLTEIEESFESVAHLHLWAVLRMFFEHAVRRELDAIEQDQAGNVGPRQLAALQRHMDRTLFCDVKEEDGSSVVTARADGEIEANLTRLRQDATLCGRPKRRGRRRATLLRTLGLWNALSEVISPGAIARIRENGTFYHLIAENPSALEWGIFWLRQASVMGSLFQFTCRSASRGTRQLTDELVKRILADCRTVELRPGHEVRSIVQPRGSSTVVVVAGTRTDDRDPSPGFCEPASHVILALPQLPLQRLKDAFPQEVRDRLDGVAPLRLLKAFVVTVNPWWRPHLEAQAYAWLVPTRELHFYRPVARKCRKLRNPALPCTCKGHLTEHQASVGMIMLYTDEPAIGYWQALMEPEQREVRTWRPYTGSAAADEVRARPNGLLASLIRRLLVIPDPGLARRINVDQKRIMELMHQREPELAKRIKRQPGPGHLLAEKIYNATGTKGDQKLVEAVLREVPIELDPNWREWLKTAIDHAKFALDIEGETSKRANDIRAYGIRDWSAPPFGGAAHVWQPGHDADGGGGGGAARRSDPGDRLLAFKLNGARSAGVANVHICGEAYSSFQGFIEGALRTAEDVVETILRRPYDGPPLQLTRTAYELEQRWSADREDRLTLGWSRLQA